MKKKDKFVYIFLTSRRKFKNEKSQIIDQKHEKKKEGEEGNCIYTK